MKRIKTALLTIGAVAAAALTLSIFTPKAAQAFQEVMAIVANTRANPVPNQDVDQAARHPYTATYSHDQSGFTISCQPMPLPPANSELVIQSVDMSLNTFTANSGTPINGYVNYTSGGHGGVMYVPFTTPPTGPSGPFWPAHAMTAIYQDPPGAVLCNINAAGLAPDGIITCTVSGYYVTLP